MKKFKDFGIKVATVGFTGDKIKISKVLNREIKVLDFKLENSKFDGQRLDIQIEINGTKHLLWTGSKGLIETIKQVPKSEFPFETTIVEQDERYAFT